MPPCCLPSQVEPPHCVLQGPQILLVQPCLLMLWFTLCVSYQHTSSRFSSWTFFSYCHIFSLIEILFFKVFSTPLPQTSLFQIFTSLHAGAICLNFHNLAFSFITWYFTCGFNLAPPLPPLRRVMRVQSAISSFQAISFLRAETTHFPLYLPLFLCNT